MRRFVVFIVFLLCPFFCFAQWKVIKTFPLSQTSNHKIGVSGKTILVSVPGRTSLDNTIYRSLDNGISWNELSTVSFTSERVSRITTLGKYFFVFTEIDKGTGTLFHLFRIQDSSNTWTKMDFAVPDSLRIISLQNTGSRLLAAVAYPNPMGPVPGTGGGFRFYQSSDLGNSWAVIGSDYVTNLWPEFSVTMGNKIFFSQYSAFYESDDGGFTWIKRIDAPIKDGPFTFVKQNNVLYASPVLGRSFLPGIYRSLDSGVTWQNLQAGIASQGTYGLMNYGENLLGYIGPTDHMKFYIENLIISTNRGESWSEFNTGLPDLSFFDWVEDVVHGDQSLFILAMRKSPQPKQAGDLEAQLYSRPVSELPASIRQNGKDKTHFGFVKNSSREAHSKNMVTIFIDQPGNVNLDGYDSRGIKFQVLQNQFLNQGTHSLSLNGLKISSGKHFFRLSSKNGDQLATFIHE